MRERLGDEPHTPLSHYCSPYHTNTALYPVITQLERAAGFAADDESGDKLAKLEALLGQATGGLDGVMPLIAALLGLPIGDRHAPLNLSPQRQKQRTLEVLIEQLAGLAQERPVLELYEDVHWVDPSTRELLDLLVERVRSLPVLVVLTYRPEFNPPWTGQSHVTALTMNRLGRRQGAAMVDRIAGGKALPAEVLDQILAKTDGVPLFVEELTKTVLESGLLADVGDRYELAGHLPPLAIPATLHDFSHGTFGSPCAGQGSRPDRRGDRPRFHSGAARCGLPSVRSRSHRRARPAGLIRARLSPRRPTRSDL